MNAVERLMRALFFLLYHPFAFAYDAVAAAVSLGHWNEWITSVLPWIHGPRVLELGAGPGHLQEALRSRVPAAFGLDESRQMVALASRRLRSGGFGQPNLVRAVSGDLPFSPGSFQTVVATFPSTTIFGPRALGEAHRVLSTGGRLIVLPLVWHTGRRILERLLVRIFRITGESPGPFELVAQRFREAPVAAGFQVEIIRLEVRSALLLLLVAEKPA